MRQALMPGFLGFFFLLLFLPGVGAATVTYTGPSSFPTIDCIYTTAADCTNSLYGTFTVTYTPSQNIAPGGNIRIVFGHEFDNTFFLDVYSTWPTPQIIYPASPNYTKVYSSAPVQVTSTSGLPPLFKVKFPSGLTAGTPVSITFGDTSGGSVGFRIPPFELESEILVEEDAQGSGTGTLVPGPHPILWVTGTKADRVAVVAPSTVILPPKPVEFLVKVMEGADTFYNNSYTTGTFAGTVAFSSTDPLAKLPAPYAFRPLDKGVKKFTATFYTPGIQTITATIQSTSTSGTSNPMVVKPDPPKTVAGIQTNESPHDYKVYWGGLHNHTSVGGHGLQTPYFAFDYGRDKAFLQFMAVSEHCGKAPFNWNDLEVISERYYEPGSFVTFPAYEWTSFLEGHRHVLFYDASQGTAFCDLANNQATQGEQNSFTLAELLNFLSPLNAIALLHHPAWTISQGVNWGPISSATQRLVEIYSWHGRSEYYDNPLVIHNNSQKQFGPDSNNFIQDALFNGYRLGITADADNHFGMPGSNVGRGFGNGFYSRMGITAVYASALDKPAIWEALNARRTYGTTGARILLEFTVNEHVMGEEFTTTAPPELNVKVIGTAPIDYVKIFKNGKQEIYSWTNTTNSNIAEFSYKDLNVQTGQLYNYYVRVHQTDDHYAWSSPIWVNYAGALFAMAPGIREREQNPLVIRGKSTQWVEDIQLNLVNMVRGWMGLKPLEPTGRPYPNPEELAYYDEHHEDD